MGILCEHKKFLNITEEKLINEIRKLICEKKEWFYLLSRKQQLLAHLICEVPIMYPILYRIYAKILLKNKYV